MRNKLGESSTASFESILQGLLISIAFFNQKSAGLIECLLPVFLKSRSCPIAGKMPCFRSMFEEFTVAAKLQKWTNFSENILLKAHFTFIDTCLKYTHVQGTRIEL